ncbi:hypothetical protein [Helicobacter enhydrae]|uniref:hypothetical protein n=1 Tax=Helicobacter enhydrae TaxID=222136 RepID=UPI0019007534|nr:hypothetical protein [Helicobacter enhydrae]
MLIARGSVVPTPLELNDSEEILIARAWSLSLKVESGWSEGRLVSDYLVVRDFCKKFGLCPLLVQEVCKEMCECGS